VEILGIDLVHGAKVAQVLYKDRGFDNIVQGQTGFGQHGLQVLQGLMSLCRYALSQSAGGGVNTQLAAAVNGAAGVYGLHIRAESGGGFIGYDTLHTKQLPLNW